jgi:P-type Mg2+ transporter
MPPTIAEKAWWLTTLEEGRAGLLPGAEGLSQKEAHKRLKLYGRNVFRDRPRPPLIVEFAKRFRNPLVIVLLGASLVSALTGEVQSFVIIMLMVTLSVTIDFVQEYRADRTAERLRQSVMVHASVLRDGTKRSLPVAQIVPGDICLLAAGDLVPADGRLIEARDLFVNQALLTGEPYPAEKHAGDLGAGSEELSSATNALFMGTSVVSGTGTLLVRRTGRATAMGEIADTLMVAPPPTAFETGTRRFGMLIMRLTVFLVLFVLFVNTLAAKPLLESFLFAIALAVGLTPELLPMVVSVTLARGAQRMAKRKVVVKRLAAIENLGSMDVLCTDKTGTLTEAKIHLERHLDADGKESERVLSLAYLNSYFETGLKSPLDEAILAHEHLDVSSWRKIDEVPFDFERRRLSVLVDDGGTRLLVVKGAPEDVMALSKSYEATEAVSPLPFDEDARKTARTYHDQLGREGFRVLGIAWKRVPSDHTSATIGDESELVFAGFAAFLDPPKPSAAHALGALAESGIAVKILTGDSELVTQYLCATLKIPVTGTLTGQDLVHMDDHALQARVETANLFCRVNPAQKNRIILALKARGHTVGYLGDGVNDAPSLHSADVGLSVDSAVDVAKEAADMILLKHDLHVLHDGVVEGRGTFRNIMKYIMMGTSSNFGNMFSMAGAALFLPFLPMLPTQILLNNILYDLSEVPIPLDRVDPEEIRTPQKWDMTFIRNYMWVIGPVSSLFDFLTFYVLLAVLHADEALFQTGWFIESLASQVLVIFIIRSRGNPLTNRPSVALVVTSLAVVAVAVSLPATSLGARFGFVVPPEEFFWLLAALVITYLVLVQLVKRGFYRYLARDA